MNLFLNKLYSVEEKRKNMIKVRLNPNHEIFAGHFPNNPVLPGVCVLQIVKEILQRSVISKIGYIRYYHPINPNIIQCLIFSFEEEKRRITVSVVILNYGYKITVKNKGIKTNSCCGCGRWIHSAV
jgi:3-hydroxyacyl-[acyl-carrier-protein] dehydratase